MISGNVVAGKCESLRAAVRQLLDHLLVIEDEDIRQNYQTVLERMDEVLESAVARERKVQGDGNLSAAGQRAAMLQVWQDTLQALAFVGEKAATITESAASLRAELLALPPAPKGQDAVVTLLYEQETRAYLRTLPAPERMKDYLRAVDDRDAHTVRAFRLAPGPALIPNDFRERIDRESIEMKEPKRWMRLQSLDTLGQQLSSLSDTFTRSLSPGYDASFPTPQPRPMQSMIGGGKPVQPRAENF